MFGQFGSLRRTVFAILFSLLMTSITAFAQKAAKEPFDKGIEYRMQGKFDEAIAEFNKAIEINPNDAQAYNNRGEAYFHKGNYDQAISDSNKAIELDPNSDQAYANRALAYHSKGEYDMAWEDVHKVESLGAKVDPIFFKALKEGLKKDSGRDK